MASGRAATVGYGAVTLSFWPGNGRRPPNVLTALRRRNIFLRKHRITERTLKDYRWSCWLLRRRPYSLPGEGLRTTSGARSIG